ncbi:MAG: hypothetical protein LBL96_01900 [Clostridiales bacterium]|jgi:V/A-type H+-transporting ATPase subunit I|nr:hypothetical protein [Clostridiales bacterium]
MVERMMYVNLMGRILDLDRVIEKYVSRFDIQFEYASHELPGAEGLIQLPSANPYSDAMRKIENMEKIAPLPATGQTSMAIDEALMVLDEAWEMYKERDERLKELDAQKQELEAFNKALLPFMSLKFDMAKLSEFRLINITFGKMPVSNFRQFEAFLYDDPEILFVQSDRTKEYIWGLYACPITYGEKVDSIFSSLHFERVKLNSNFYGEALSGEPERVMRQIDDKLSSVLAEISRLNNMSPDFANRPERLPEAAAVVRRIHDVYEIRKYASKTPNDFYVFVGWMSERDAKRLQKEIGDDNMVVLVNESEKIMANSSPPTKLNNLPIIRYFEFFTAMYGMPGYGEFDPTPFVAVTYTLLFGLMFGDLGQGALIAALGYYLYRKRGFSLGAIMAVVGVSAMVFGALYGSVFGFEEWLPALWRRPASDINSTLFFAVGAGILLIVSSMVINITNALKQKSWGKLLFSPNGVSGLLFYLAIVGIVLCALNGLTALAVALGIVFVAVPLILIALREPLTKIIEGRKAKLESGPAMFVLETIIELFEVLLTYFTNTVSFVRVGAFALSHAGMMGVVMLLARSATGGDRNIAVIVMGNIVVMALEGLLIGIQGLRLEFYEMFSRFFSGNGRAFRSYREMK